MIPLLTEEMAHTITSALNEDVGAGDLSAFLVPEESVAFAQLIVRESGVLCGVDWFNAVILKLAPEAQINWFFKDGDSLEENTVLCEIRASARALLTAERTALNFLQTLSAVATKTRRFVNLIASTRACIVDTRKTIPGLRMAQKYAVDCGGGKNHRFALWDAILIKENHIHAAGSIEKAFLAAQQIAQAYPQCRFVQVEVENLSELQQAIAAGAKMILLDNFSLSQMQEAVRLAPQDVILEASGNVNEANVLAIAQTGVQRISIGALTKDIKALDLSLRFL